MSVSRRAVLAGGVLAGTAAAVAGGVVYAERRDDSPEQPEFYGVHQAGIADDAYHHLTRIAEDAHAQPHAP